ncbi:MAG: RDD family protein [Novosphingobium sp.]|nr:RDD family protein [Novosphingobium sp.]
MASNPYLAAQAKRRRELVTPEGLSLPLTVAGRGARAAALILDYLLINTVLIATTIFLLYLAFGVLGLKDGAGPGQLFGTLEFLAVVWLIAMFLFRYGYFLFFELGPRGATPGKRLMGIRIAARDGGRLTAEAVIARNLLRDIELFLPIMFIASAQQGEGGLAGMAAAAWLAVFLLFPFFNKDALRAGDLIAGTWVVEAPKRKLAETLSLAEGARGPSQATGATYQFGEAELSVYGEFELQALERVLREGRPEALATVAETICGKIGWNTGKGDERAFLEAYYTQLRARLERDMRFGKRKADKHS